jgi:hypothetical protein
VCLPVGIEHCFERLEVCSRAKIRTLAVQCHDPDRRFTEGEKGFRQFVSGGAVERVPLLRSGERDSADSAGGA